MSRPTDATHLAEAYEQFWFLPEEAPLEAYQQLAHAIGTLEATLPPATVTDTLEQTARAFPARPDAAPSAGSRDSCTSPRQRTGDNRRTSMIALHHCRTLVDYDPAT